MKLMARYRLEMIETLAKQLAFAPLQVRDAQLANAETLAISIDPGKAYPPDYIIFRITGYDPKDAPSDLLTGLALQHDLGLLVEQVSDTLRQKTTDRAEPVLTIDDLTEKFNVTSKTIQRWRRRGLSARRFVFPDGKRRVGFRLAIVEQFLAAHRDAVERGSNFSQVDDAEREQILARARRLAMQCRCCVNEISRRIARKLDRSPLTIQATIRKHDAEHPEQAIFPAAPAPMVESDRVRIVRIVRSGGTLRQAARRTRQPKTAVYRVIVDDRLARLTKRKAKFIDDPLYHADDAEAMLNEMVRQQTLEATPAGEASRIPTDLPPYLRDLYRTPLLTPARERALFLKFNFHKFQFAQARRRVDPSCVRAKQLDELERIYRSATDTKNDIVRANLRLVVSVARKHQRPGASLMELVSEGNLTLMRAVESFDVHKGNKFSTYATLALMKGYARSVPQILAARKGAGAAPIAGEIADRIATPIDHLATRDEVRALLSQLDDREQQVIRAQFGMDDVAEVEALATRLGVSRQRLRQIERAALTKLRAAAGVDAN